MRKIIIILDGLADQIKTKTSLELAKTPNLDKLTKNSLCGLMYPIKNIAPESGAAQFVILGNKLKDFPGRGPLEALGINKTLKPNQIAIRCNFAKVKVNKIIHIREKIPKKNIIDRINKIDKDIKLHPSVGYRAVLIVNNASTNITNTHPGYIRYKHFSKAVTRTRIERKVKGHKQTANKLNSFIKELEKITKNSTLLLRGAGKTPKKFKQFKNWSMLADMPVEKGLAKILGMKILKREKDEMKQILKTKSNLYVQIKGADTYGHKGNKKQKIKAIEKIDKLLKPLIGLKDIIVITADHATPPNLKRHSKDPVPFLIYNKTPNNINKFTEKACKRGKIIEGKDLMKLL